MSEWLQVSLVLPRRFALVRHVDYTGVSGIGVVAYGVVFADGHVVLRWCSTHPATSMWTSMADLVAVHGHGEATSIDWIDAPHGEVESVPVPADSGRRARRRASRTASPDDAPDNAPEPEPESPAASHQTPGPPSEQQTKPTEDEPAHPVDPLPRNGHAWIDTMPGLLDLPPELLDSPARVGPPTDSATRPPQPRRPGRHRRPVPDDVTEARP